MIIDQIRAEIAKGEIRNAIKLLQNSSMGHEDELSIYLMQLSMLEKNIRMGITGFEASNIQVSKISLSVLELAKRIEDDLHELIESKFVPNHKTHSYSSRLQENWGDLFDYLGWKFMADVKKTENWLSDFLIQGEGKREVEFEIKRIAHIDELKNKSRYIKPEIPETSLSNCIILGKTPFISTLESNNDDSFIQIGWVFNLDGFQWDKIALKANSDISNTSNIIYDLLKPSSDSRGYMSINRFEEIKAFWS